MVRFISTRAFFAATAFVAVLAVPAVSRAAECAADADCGSDAWCQTSTGACVERVANGQPCTTNDACTGGVCGSDGKCGGVNGQAVCTQPEEDGECRSGACSSSGVCVPHIGGCWLDSDCPNAQFCNRTTYACSAVLADGEPLPNDGLHELCVAGEPNDACRSGSCDPSTKTCGSEAPTAADVVAKDAGPTSQVTPSTSADAGSGNAESNEKSSITSSDTGNDDSNANGMACSSSGTNGASGVGGFFDLLIVAGGLLMFRRATAKAIASSRTDRRRSPAE